MSGPAVQEEQLLQLLLQLKKTTPESARAILNSQPQIAYALMAVMVNMNAVHVGVIQKTVADFTANVAAANSAAVPSSTPIPALPILQPTPPVRPMPPPEAARPPSNAPGYPRSNAQYPPRNGTPSGPPGPPILQTMPIQPGPPSFYGHPGPSYPQAPGPMPPPQPYGAHGGPPPGYGVPPGVPPPGYGTPPGGPPPGFQLPPAFANIPDDQKALLMKVVSMSPQEIYSKPPQERASLIQLRQTLGVPV